MEETTCIIIDDEPIAIRILERHLEVFPDIKVLATFNQAGEALRFIRSQRVDLIFLDIEMPRMTGIEFIKSLQHKPAIVLTTAYRNYAVEAYDMDVVDYLLKPISVERLGRSIHRYYAQQSLVPKPGTHDRDKVLNIKTNKEVVRLCASSIHYIESFGDYIIIYSDKGKIISRERISRMYEELSSSDFIRIHRRYLVSISRVESVQGNIIQISGKSLPVGRTYRSSLKVALGV